MRFQTDQSRAARDVILVLVSVALAAVLAPIGVRAATNLVVLKDADSTGKAQVDAGRVRVGDGSGPLTVDGTVGVAEPLTVDGTVDITEPVTVDGSVDITEPVTVDGSVGLTPGSGVQIQNSSVPIRDLGDATDPFSYNNGGFASYPASTNYSNSFTVPAGKRLVIESVSMSANMTTGQKLFRANVNTTAGGSPSIHELEIVPVGSVAFAGATRDWFTISEDLRHYADPGTTVTFTAIRDTSSTAATGIYWALSGYLVPV